MEADEPKNREPDQSTGKESTIMTSTQSWASSGAKPVAAPDVASVYRVALCCKAAPGLGCGSRAKPVLVSLAGHSAISEAWLSRDGTLLAVVWRGTHQKRDAVISQMLAQHGLSSDPLPTARREEDFREIVWYQGTDVDRLSEEEAQIIAGRLVRRLHVKVTLPEDRVMALRLAFTEACQHELLHHPAEPAEARQARLASKLVEAGQYYLDEREMGALQKAIALGYRPLPGEA